MFKYSNNIKLKNKPKKESLDELSKRGITVYDNKGNAVNSASNGNALTDVIKKTVTKAKSTVNNTLNNVKTPSSSASTVSAPEVTAKNIGSITYNTALKANTSALDKKGITVYDKVGKPFSTTVKSDNTTSNGSWDYSGGVNKSITGQKIKSNIINALTKNNGKLPWIKDLYNTIDDKAVEDNIALADEAIGYNLKSGRLKSYDLEKLPYLRDGLAFSYAAGESGNKMAEREARKLAYETFEAVDDKRYGWVLANNSVNKITDLSNSKKASIPNSRYSPFSPSIPSYRRPGVKISAASPQTTVYYGKIGLANEGEDLEYGDYTKEKLDKIFGISRTELGYYEKEHIQRFKEWVDTTSYGEMQDVAYSMVNHFIDGTGTDYQNETLTKNVEKHSETQRYMNDFTRVFKEQLNLYKGDISKVADSESFHDELKKNDVLLSKYDYSGIGDFLGGLMITIHSWTESEVKMSGFKINDKGEYSCVLEFTFKDVFGLDKADIEEYWYIGGFRSWFILQHNEEYQGKYKPFNTVVKLYKKIDGKIEGYNENKTV